MVKPGGKEPEQIRSRYRYMVGIIRALREMGGEAAVGSVYAWLNDHGVADAADLAIVQRDGGTRFRKEVRWARKELFDADYLSAPVAGHWGLSQAGGRAEITVEEAQAIVRENTRVRRGKRNRPGPQPPTDAEEGWEWGSVSGAAKAAQGPTTGPAPTDWAGDASRKTGVPTWTYVVRFGSHDLWKIGHASDLGGRLADINRHVPTEVLGRGWSVVASRRWSDASKAYAMEQALLAALKAYRTVGERVACSEDAVKRIWEEAS